MSLQNDSSKIKHDINSAVSSLLSALQLINDEWDKNPELVERILPLTKEKLSELDLIISDLYKNK